MHLNMSTIKGTKAIIEIRAVFEAFRDLGGYKDIACWKVAIRFIQEEESINNLIEAAY